MVSITMKGRIWAAEAPTIPSGSATGAKMATHLYIWFVPMLGTIGRRFTTTLAMECQGVLSQKCNPKRPLGVSHVILMLTLRPHRDREIWKHTIRWLDLWERYIHAELIGDIET